MTDRLKNKVALITGGAQGLGKEMAKSMIKEGARVIISDINEDVLQKTAEEIWSLSEMTLPHGLVRIIIIEQLYRANTITQGGPYHKG